MERALKDDLVKEKPENSPKKDGLPSRTAWEKFKNKLARRTVILGISVAVAIPFAVSCEMGNPNFRIEDASADTGVDIDTDTDTDGDMDTDSDADGGTPNLYYSEVCFNSGVDTELIDFPAYLSFDHASKVSDEKSQADYSDIYFTNISGDGYWEWELEKNTNNTANTIFWVKIPTFSAQSSETCGRIYYSGTESAEHAENASEVWDSNFVLVWHFGETTGNHLDSTGNNHVGTPANLVAQGDKTFGLLGGADEFNGVSSRVCTPDIADLDVEYITLSAWFIADILDAYENLISKWWDGSNRGYALMITETPKQIYGDFATTTSNSDHLVGSGIIYVAGSKAYGSARKNTTHQMTSHNTTIGSGVLTNPIRKNNVQLCVGVDGRAGYTDYFDGKIDEIRISNIARSDNWMLAEYGQTYSIGAETAVE